MILLEKNLQKAMFLGPFKWIQNQESLNMYNILSKS